MGLGLTAIPAGQAVSASSRATWELSLRGGAGQSVNDLAATGPHDAWAAGARRTARLDRRTGSRFTAPLIRHWNGRQWTVAASPAGPPGCPLREVHLIEASSPGNVWIAGTAVAPGTGDAAAATRSVLSRWDGRRWRLMGSGRTTVTDLDVLGAAHTWIVGRDDRTGGTFFKHLHDGRWTSLPAPDSLKEISVRSPGEIWGVGRSTLMRWNGRAWSTVRLPRIVVPAAPAPAYGPVRPRIDTVLATGKNEAWVAVGFQQGDWSQPGTVLLHWRSGRWRQIRLPEDVVTTLSHDGRGGFHAATRRQSITATPDGQDPYAYTTLSIDSLRYTAGRLTRDRLTGTATGFEWSDLVAVPGTGSALAAGFNWRPPQSAVIFRRTG
ncbi:hypothetical protein [Thermocatellispora tengchongensis]|uniref:hypothetical protein n=1 Tax=Thermocatellispora tengchongensis TaxID=1073253 RepID=UPI00362945C4